MAAVPFGLFVRFVVAQTLDYWIDRADYSLFEATREDANIEGRRVQFVFDQPADTHWSTRDRCIWDLTFLKLDGGDPTSAWTDGDLDNLDDALADLWTAIKPAFDQETKLEELRYYAAGPAVVPPSPVLRVTAVAVNATGGAHAMPPQVACTLTLRTAIRKSWGRAYLPAPSQGLLTAYGRLGSTTVDDLAEGFAAAFAALEINNIVPAVYSPTSQSFLGVAALEVDDNLDVIRSRRKATTGYRDIIDA